MRKGFMYLVGVMDWYSRYILSWVLSNSLSVDFCLESLDIAFRIAKPEINNLRPGKPVYIRRICKKA
jgi:putative transposase